MKGVQYVVNEKGKPQAVLIDLRTHGELWEDFSDILISRRRCKEAREPLVQLEARLKTGRRRSRKA